MYATPLALTSADRDKLAKVKIQHQLAAFAQLRQKHNLKGCILALTTKGLNIIAQDDGVITQLTAIAEDAWLLLGIEKFTVCIDGIPQQSISYSPLPSSSSSSSFWDGWLG